MMPKCLIIEKLLAIGPLLLIILLLIYSVYTSFFKNAAEKHYDWMKQVSPFLLFIKNKKVYVLMHKIAMLAMLLAMIYLLIRG